MKTTTRRDVLLFAGLALVTAGAARAATPTGPVLLTVKGKIGGSDSGTAEFDLAMLEALPKTSFKTSSPWTAAGTLFEGVALKDLAEIVGATGATITAQALNDYSVSFPLEKAAAAGGIIAYRMNGDIMSVRDKGPLWIVYPFDDRPELKTETNYSHCVWQLAVIEFQD